jgi:tetratricopeptide (TPR) repeat protein
MRAEGVGGHILLCFIFCSSLAWGQQTADAVFRSGQAAQARGDRAEATRQFERAAGLYAQMESQAAAQRRVLPAATLQRYAFALAMVGRTDEATKEMQAASAADPKNATLHDNVGSLYAQQQQWPRAESEFAAASHLKPLNAEMHLHLGLAMQAQGEPDALKEIERASKLDPLNEAIALQYGSALAASGDDAKAIDVLQRLLVRRPSDVGAMYPLALALQRSDRVPEAVALFQKVLKAQPDNADAMTNLGMALTQERRAKDAVPVLQKAVELAPQNVTAIEDLAAAYVQLNQFEDAVAQLQAALRLAPEIPQLHYDLGLAYKMEDDAAHAAPELERAQALDPKAPEAPLALGMLYMQGGRYQDAARELESSLAMRPRNGDAWATLGSVYNKLDRLPEAETALHKAIEQLPEQPDPHLTLAAVYVKENKTADALAERKQAAELMRGNMNRQRAEVATHSGESLLKGGDLAGATAQFKDALGFDAGYGEAHEGLAKVYDAQGKRADAAAERANLNAGTGRRSGRVHSCDSLAIIRSDGGEKKSAVAAVFPDDDAVHRTGAVCVVEPFASADSPRGRGRDRQGTGRAEGLRGQGAPDLPVHLGRVVRGSLWNGKAGFAGQCLDRRRRFH